MTTSHTPTTDALTTGYIAEFLSAEIIGDEHLPIHRISPVATAQAGSITFVTARQYLRALGQSKASAVILAEHSSDGAAVTQLLVADPYLAYARLTSLFLTDHRVEECIHPSAHIDDGVVLGSSVRVEAGATIAAGTVIGDGCLIGQNASISRDCTIGERVRIHPSATLLEACTIGCDSEIHSGAVIGSDGFGWARDRHGWQKIHQLGAVRIGNAVSIGANTCVDRGAIDDTVIEDGVIIDNLVQIAHNVHIGRNSAIAGCVGIAGSTTIGENCTIAGAVGIVGHISICSGVHITAKSFVNRSISKPGSYSSAYPIEPTQSWRKNAVRLHTLDRMARALKRLSG